MGDSNVNLTMLKFPHLIFWASWMAFFHMHAVCAHAESRIDLEVESVQIQPLRPSAERPLTVSASLRNNGSEPAENFHASITLYRGKTKVKTIEGIPVLSRLPRQGSGISVPVEFGKFPEGDYALEFIVDPENRFDETDETNNARTVSFRVHEASKSVQYTS